MTKSFDLDVEIMEFHDSISAARGEVAQVIENSKMVMRHISHLSENECEEISRELVAILDNLNKIYEQVSY